MKRLYGSRILIVLALFLHALFAHAQSTDTLMAEPQAEATLTKDPFEGFNRGAHQFNEGWDQVIFRPAAQAYQKLTPNGARGCVSNFFDNLSTPYTVANNILQGKFKAAGQDMCRFVVNSTVGLAGCFDVASQMNIPKHDEDFGQTLGAWGVPSGPFIMLPGLGPSTLRDALSKPIDFLADPIAYLKIAKLRYGMRGMRLLDTRSKLLETLDFADDIALDKYALQRDTWLQYREAQVKDENYAPDVAPLVDQSEPPLQATPLEPLAQELPAVVEEKLPPLQSSLQQEVEKPAVSASIP